MSEENDSVKDQRDDSGVVAPSGSGGADSSCSDSGSDRNVRYCLVATASKSDQADPDDSESSEEDDSKSVDPEEESDGSNVSRNQSESEESSVDSKVNFFTIVVHALIFLC